MMQYPLPCTSMVCLQCIRQLSDCTTGSLGVIFDYCMQDPRSSLIHANSALYAETSHVYNTMKIPMWAMHGCT